MLKPPRKFHRGAVTGWMTLRLIPSARNSKGVATNLSASRPGFCGPPAHSPGLLRATSTQPRASGPGQPGQPPHLGGGRPPRSPSFPASALPQIPPGFRSAEPRAAPPAPPRRLRAEPPNASPPSLFLNKPLRLGEGFPGGRLPLPQLPGHQLRAPRSPPPDTHERGSPRKVSQAPPKNFAACPRPPAPGAQPRRQGCPRGTDTRTRS